MSLVIKSGAGTELWTIDGTSNAGRVTLYDAQGNPIQIGDKATLSATQKAQMSMGSDGKVGRFVRVDEYGNQSVTQGSLCWYEAIEGAAVNTLT